jgi:hypothetical protein
MAVVTTKSQTITNRDATPRVLSNGRVQGAPVLEAGELVTIVNGDSATSKYIFFSVPSNALVRSLKYSAPDIGTTTACDIGLYRTTADGGAVVDVDFWVSAVALNAGPYNKVEVIQEAGAAGGDITKFMQPIWQILGLTADPNIVYDVVATLTGAADAGGTLILEMQYQM